MARPLKPLVRGGGYYPSRKWTPLVYAGGYTTANGGGEPEPPPIEKTITGNPIHITDALAKPAQALSVKPEPIQDLHGYDNPWPAGGGKNLFDSSIFPASASQNIIYVHYEVANGTYTMSTPDFPLVGGLSNVFFLAGAVSSGAVSGQSGVAQSTPRTITVADGYYTVAYRSSNDINTNNPKDFKWQIESGSTATSYAPYSNICPIYGHTDADVTRTGKNLVNVNSTENINAYIDSLGRIRANGAWKTCSYIPVEAGKSYCLSGLTSHPNSGTDNYLTYDKNKTLLGVVALNINSYPVTFNASVAFVRFCWKISEEATVMFEQSPTATSYEPYSGNTYPIPLGQTVYGGTLDVLTGVLTVTMGYVDLGTIHWGVASTSVSGKSRFFGTLNGMKPAEENTSRGNLVSSEYVVESLNGTYLCRNGVAVNLFGKGLYIYDSTKDTMTAQEFKTAMSGVQLAYELATPQTIQLTPTQVELLLGENNLFSDGEMTLVYLADGNASDEEALNILLGNRYVNNHGEDEPTDREALDILLGGTR